MINSELGKIKQLPLIVQVDKLANEINRAQRKQAINDLAAFSHQLLSLYLEAQSKLNELEKTKEQQ